MSTVNRINYLPVKSGTKCPDCNWREFQTKHYPSELRPFDARGVVCGAISGNLTALDFDDKGSAFKAWSELVGADAPELLERVYIESTPSGGYHVLFRSVEPARPNEKLARKESGEVLIETRGEGGFCVVEPTPSYFAISGDLDNLPQLSPEEVSVLVSSAKKFNLYTAPSSPRRQNKETASGEDWLDSLRENRKGYDWILEELERAGWSFIRETAEGSLWGHPIASNPLDNHIVVHFDGHLYCYASGAKNAPFEGDTSYSPSDALALLLGVDFKGLKKAYFKRYPEESVRLIDFTKLLAPTAEEEEEEKEKGAPENKELIKKVLESVKTNYPLLESIRASAIENAPRPQEFLSLIPALSAVSGLSCHKVNVKGGGSLNLAFCCVAPSGYGKDRLFKTLGALFVGGCSLGADLKIRRGCRLGKLAKTAPQFIYDVLDSPVSVFYADEFQDLLGRKKGSSGGYDAEVFSIYKEVSTIGGGDFNPAQSVNMRRALEERAKEGLATTAKAPAVGLFLGGTDSIFKNLNQQDLEDGLVRRLLFFYNPVRPPKATPTDDLFSMSPNVELSESVVKWVDAIQSLDDFSIGVDKLPADVVKFISSESERIESIPRDKTTPPLYLSYEEALRKLSAVLAFSRLDPLEDRSISVNLSDVETANALLQISCNDFINGRKSYAPEVPEWKQAELFHQERIIALIKKKNGANRTALYKQLKRSYTITIGEFSKVIDSLVENGAIEEVGGCLMYRK